MRKSHDTLRKRCRYKPKLFAKLSIAFHAGAGSHARQASLFVTRYAQKSTPRQI